MANDGSDPLELWDIDQTRAFWGGSRPVSAATIYRGVRAGRIPGPKRVGPNTSRFVASEQRAAMTKMIGGGVTEVPPPPQRKLA